MYIEPNTNVRLLRNVPINNTYEHTLYFVTSGSQSSYFMGLQKYNLANYTYQRTNSGTIRVGIKADNLYDCNYMMFQNTSFGNKWFYAFITSINYVNNECSELTYEIDVMQTWLFDYRKTRCFIEREHTATDIIGEHIEPENVALGEYVFSDYSAVQRLTDMTVCIAIVDVDGKTKGTLYDGIYGSADLWVYDSKDVSSINAKIDSYRQKPDAIIGLYMFPTALIGGSVPASHRLSYGQQATRYYVSKNPITGASTLDGYRPKNKKMYTYPYVYYHVDNANGSSMALRYEFFEDFKPTLEICGVITQPIALTIRPCNYKGKHSGELSGNKAIYTESLSLSGFPLCSANIDAYQSWVSQNATPIVLSTISNAGQIALASAYSINPKASQYAGVIGSIASIMSANYQASIAADISKGSFNNGGVNVANNCQQFYGGRCSITAEYAKVIDDFFTMYGYAVRSCDIPNINSRPHWNYVKTLGFNGVGGVPNDDMKKINMIYDKGVTFWKKGSEIGEYSLDNSV